MTTKVENLMKSKVFRKCPGGFQEASRKLLEVFGEFWRLPVPLEDFMKVGKVIDFSAFS